jgi:hypothetical protein
LNLALPLRLKLTVLLLPLSLLAFPRLAGLILSLLLPTLFTFARLLDLPPALSIVALALDLLLSLLFRALLSRCAVALLF